MELRYEDEIGTDIPYPGKIIGSYAEIDECLRDALIRYFGFDIRLTPVQEWALHEGLVTSQDDFLICTPTNSGKTLVALLRMFSQAMRGLRSVYVVPLKALAEEKGEDLRSIAMIIEEFGGPKVKIRISTGDYVTSADFLGSPPPVDGEIIVCTPERLEILLRDTENEAWSRSVATYVIDEFHMIGEQRRGIVLESTLTRLLISNPSSSIIMISATIGSPGDVVTWFKNCGRNLKVYADDYRFPPLVRKIYLGKEKDEFLTQSLSQVLSQEQGSALVFVRTKEDAKRLARKMSDLSPVDTAISWYHAGLSLADRRQRNADYRSGMIRVLITTTSLKMGVNLPATHVFIRDQVLYDSQNGGTRLSAADIQQMIGRAGRWKHAGEGVILCDNSEIAESYSLSFQSGRIDEMRSQLAPTVKLKTSVQVKEGITDIVQYRSIILSHIVRTKQCSVVDIAGFFSHSFFGVMNIFPQNTIAESIDYLERKKLVYHMEGSENQYASTKLGHTTSLTGISAESGGMIGGFLRALITLGEKQRERDGVRHDYLGRLTEIDFAFLALSSFECRRLWLRAPSVEGINRIREAIEGLDADKKPIMNLWRSSESEEFPTRRLFGSLSIPADPAEPEACERRFYQIMRTAMLLTNHAEGAKIRFLAREYDVDEGIIESGLKPTVIWILYTISQICNSRRCYKLDNLMIRILDFIEKLTFGSTLGSLLTIKGIGRTTVTKLLERGIESLDQISTLTPDDFRLHGITAMQARKIKAHAGSRNR